MNLQAKELQINAQNTSLLAQTANKAINVQNQPWIEIKNISLEAVIKEHDEIAVYNTRVHLQNRGVSPAIDILYKLFSTGNYSAPVDWHECNKLNDMENEILHPLGYDPTPTLFPGQDGMDMEDAANPFKFVDNAVTLVACVSYQTTFDKKWHHTRARYVVPAPAELHEGMKTIILLPPAKAVTAD